MTQVMNTERERKNRSNKQRNAEGCNERANGMHECQ